MSHSITIRHNFETAHRLPHLSGKCTNLHGHSWWAEVTVTAPVWTADYTIVEFGGFKAVMRQWIDEKLDHGAMLGVADPLVAALRQERSKIYIFGADTHIAEWPTVEAVAALLAEQAAIWLATAPGTPQGARIGRVVIRETGVNAAEYEPPIGFKAPTMGRMWSAATAPYGWKVENKSA